MNTSLSSAEAAKIILQPISFMFVDSIQQPFSKIDPPTDILMIWFNVYPSKLIVPSKLDA